MATAGTAIEGDGSFTLSAGATLGITSVDGITATGSGAVGNIQVTGSRNYSTNANYIYNGSSDQDVGDGLPGTVNNLTIDNSGGGGNNAVSLDSDVAISGTLTVSQGEFDLNGNNVTSVGSVVLTGTTITGGGGITLAGNITTNSSPSTATIDVPVALGGADRIFTVANGGANPDLTISGNISGANAIQKSGTGTLSLGGNNTYSGTTTLSSGTLNINSATAIGTGALTISGGSIGNTSGGPITLSNNNAQNWNSDFTFEGTNDLNVGAGPVSISANRIVTVNSNILTVGGVVSAATFDLTKTGAGTLGFGTNAVTINNLTNSGPLKAPSNVLSIAGNFINTGTFDNAFGTVHYNGTAAQLVAPVTYQNLTLSSSGAKNAGGNITVNNLLNNSAVFDLGTNALTATTINNTGTIRFSGPNNGLAVNGGTIEYYGASQTVAAGAYNNLTINQSSGEAGLSGDTDVNGTLALTARNLNLLGNNLTLGPGAGISVASPSASKMIIDGGGGQLRKEFTATGSFIFPIGDNSGALEYSPVTVNVTAAGGFAPGAYVAASVIDAKHPNNASASDFITRYWEITTSGITTPTVDVTGTYTVADLGGFTDSNVSAAQLDGVFNQTSNPWVKRAVLSGTTLAITGAPLTDGQISVFTGITLAPPTVSIDNGAAVTICEGSTVGLTTTAGGIPTLIYSWSPAANLSSTIIPNPVFTGNTVGGPTAYTVTVTDGNGITASDIINITVTTAPTADAGVATGVTCEDTSFTVTDASESNSSSILWTENGAGSFTPGTETTLNPVYNPVAADGGNLVTLTFTVNGNGSCTAAVDTKVLTIYKLPTVAAAGPDIFQCNTTAFTMAANSAIVGTGMWSEVGGPAGITITDPTNATTTVTGLAAGSSATLRWTISNGTCAPTTDDVVIRNDVQPVADADEANAGPVFDICGSLVYPSNAVAATGTGTWSKVSGPAGALVFSIGPNAPDQNITVPAYGTYVLRWTDVNLTCSDFDEITINFYNNPTVAAAGPDIFQCNTTTFTLAGNSAIVGTGLWSEVGGPAGITITDPTNATTTVTGLAAGSSATLRWTVSNGTCAPTTDDVVIRNDVQPVADADEANAGPVFDICGSLVYPSDAVAATGTGTWSKVSGPAGALVFSIGPNAPDQDITVPSYGTYVLRWTD
ncbi:MAG: autotransporter-associated beta strand repeat-containing protein, partial [Cyclobacteriaceae bacterium]|nr:autotransporter-associated beta strand repeat-containing protein [Cyclobacteriaceae bacterium]